jgi:hypothetical protein
MTERPQLMCLIEGDITLFAVEVSSDLLVLHLKDRIHDKGKNSTFRGVDAKDLTVFHVGAFRVVSSLSLTLAFQVTGSIPLKPMKNLAERFSGCVNANPRFAVEMVEPSEIMSAFFSFDDLPRDCLHIFVRRPPSSKQVNLSHQSYARSTAAISFTLVVALVVVHIFL